VQLTDNVIYRFELCIESAELHVCNINIIEVYAVFVLIGCDNYRDCSLAETHTHTAPHRSAYRSFSESTFLLYSLRSATNCAVSSPNTAAIHANVRSIPAETPELVQILPSTTHRAFATQSTSGCRALTLIVSDNSRRIEDGGRQYSPH
jgi:hypothetical protein